MSTIIESGRGNAAKLGITNSNRADVSSRSNGRFYYSSRDKGSAYVITSSYSASSGDYVMYFKNDSDERFSLGTLQVGSDNAGTFELYSVTGVASGTASAPRNIRMSSSRLSDATLYVDAAVTGLTSVNRLGILRVGANGMVSTDYEDALMLEKNDAIAIKYTGDAGNVYAMFKYFEDISDK